ncbi:hypothetical protein [Bacillus sp. Bos-x628]|uniref:hypothetical protein n=1 Tax=Bacillus maqinnsis TaxID=3229854 RepID=UPI00338F3626
MKHKPVISMEEKLHWINHESQFQKTFARLQLRSKKLDEILQRNMGGLTDERKAEGKAQ